MVTKKQNKTTTTTTKQTKIKPTASDKIFANMTNRRQLNTPPTEKTTKTKPKQPNKKQAEDLNKHFSKKDIQMGKTAHEKMLNITNY